MSRASRECCTSALWLWAASRRGTSDCTTHRWYAACACGGWGAGLGTMPRGAPESRPRTGGPPFSPHLWRQTSHNSCLSLRHICVNTCLPLLSAGQGVAGLGYFRFSRQVPRAAPGRSRPQNHSQPFWSLWWGEGTPLVGPAALVQGPRLGPFLAPRAGSIARGPR